jgi:hypothetical protein
MNLTQLYSDLNWILFNHLAKDGLNPVITLFYTENHYDTHSASAQLVGWTESVKVLNLELDDENEFEVDDSGVCDGVFIDRKDLPIYNEYLDDPIAWLLTMQLNSYKVPLNGGFVETGTDDSGPYNTFLHAVITLHKDGIVVHNLKLHGEE